MILDENSQTFKENQTINFTFSYSRPISTGYIFTM
jgi:hypothetical protein